MATKIIKAWVNGSAQNIEVEEIVSPEQELSIYERVEILEKGNVISTITLLADAWTGSANPYSQTVFINGITHNSMIDLQPTPEQLAEWQDEGLAFTTLNDNGTIYVYVSGGKPTEDITVQVKVQEVVINE